MIFNVGGGKPLELPTLNPNYPANATTGVYESITVTVAITTDGNPASYTYQWYVNGSAVSGATSASYMYTPTAKGTTSIYCKVTNKAGSVNSRTATITTSYAYLYKPNNECTNLTGGWKAIGWAADDSGNRPGGSPSIQKTANYLRMYGAAGSGQGHALIPSKDINLTGFNTLTIKFKASYVDGGWGFACVVPRSAASWRYNAVASSWFNPATSTTTVTVNVASISGSYCLGMFINANHGAFDLYVYEVKLS